MKKKTKKKDTSPQPPTVSESKCCVVGVCKKSKYKFIDSVEQEIKLLSNKLKCSEEELFEAMMFYVVANKVKYYAGSEGMVRPLLESVKRIKS